nr:carbohydrate kinase family protein [Maliibacterium massiliense]
MEKRYDVLCVGHGSCDVLLRPVDPDVMEKDAIALESVVTASGGDALNGSVNMARLGLKVGIMCCIGYDSFGDQVMLELTRAGVDTACVQRSQAWQTNSPFLLVEPSGERHILSFNGGANQNLCPEMLDDATLAEARHLHVVSVNMLPKLDGAPLADLLRRAHALGVTTSMDVTHDRTGRWLENIREALPHCDIFLPSHYEAAQYCGGETDPQKLKAVFQDLGVKIFGLKMGAEGAFVTDFTQDIMMPSFCAGAPVDTTGGGDAFCAGFVTGFVKGYGLEACAALGAAQAASVIACVGANRGAGTFAMAKELAASRGYTIGV